MAPRHLPRLPLPLRLVVPLLVASAAGACAGRPAVAPEDGGGRVDLAAPDLAVPRDMSGDRGALDLPAADLPFDAGPGPDMPVPDMPVTRGTCRTYRDCDSKTCFELGGTGGWNTCQILAPPEATSCMPPGGPGMDQCCLSGDCTGGMNGGCFAGPLYFCGGAPPLPGNVCVYDECIDGQPCPASSPGLIGYCLPKGAFGEVRSRCSQNECLYDSQCQSRAGGQCLPFFDPCNGRFQAFYCTYDDSVCRTDQDCQGQVMSGEPYCTSDGDGHTRCEGFFPPP
jgi:hypothetical protein